MCKWKHLSVAIVVAVGIVGAIDYLSDGGLAFQRETSMQPRGPGPSVPIPPPTPIGSADAKVRLLAFVESGNHCHGMTILTLRAAAEALPNYIRLEFADTNSGAGKQAADAAGIHCKSGLLINSKRNLEYKDKDGKMNAVEFSGPLGMSPTFSSDILSLVLVHELRSKYATAVSQSDMDTLTAAIKKAAATSGSSGAAHGP